MGATTNSREYRYMISALCVINCMSKTFVRCSVLCNIKIFRTQLIFRRTKENILLLCLCARVCSCILENGKNGKIVSSFQHPAWEGEWARQKPRYRERERVRDTETNAHFSASTQFYPIWSTFLNKCYTQVQWHKVKSVFIVVAVDGRSPEKKNQQKKIFNRIKCVYGIVRESCVDMVKNSIHLM